MNRQKKALIVGIDPGSTSAVSAVDLDGELELLESGKNFPPSEIIERIVEIGRPVVVASDKEKTPSTVDDIARSVGAEVFEPENDLDSDRKRELGRGSNSHEKDAVASAYHAYNSLQREVKKIEKYNQRMDIRRSEVAKRYFSDRPLKEEKKSDEEEKETETVSDQDRETDREKERLRRKIKNLEDQVKSLNSKLGEEKKEKENLQEKYEDLRNEKKEEMLKEHEIKKREGIIKEKNREIDDLEQKLENAKIREKKYREAIEEIREGAQPVPIVDERTEEVPEKAVTRTRELKEKIKERGSNVHLIEDVEGIELKNFYVAKEFPDYEENFKEIIKDYRDSR